MLCAITFIPREMAVLLFGTEDFYIFQKAKIALVSAAWRKCAVNPAQLIQVMQLLYWRHLKRRTSKDGF